MRGKVVETLDKALDGGITPAYAGKSARWLQGQPLLQDHPRLCGEKGFGLFPQPLHTGSPPPMRGKVPMSQVYEDMRGITPAYAGKSRGRSRFRLLSKDHPRLCGEKASHHTACVHAARITPAYAGKSSPHLSGVFNSRDHPRLCGEKFFQYASALQMSGSPPPMRGKGIFFGIYAVIIGITPAYAGKSD